MKYSDEAVITLSGGEQKIEFIHSHNFYHIQNLGSAAVKISTAPNLSGRDDGVIEIPAGGSSTISSGKENIIYIYGSGKVNVAATDSNINPFRNTARGGGGGGGTGVSSYPELTDLPSINGHTLLGNKTAEELGITGGGGSVSVDDHLSSTSINPVQNKIINQALNDILNSLDTQLSSSSTNPVQNRVITQALTDYLKDAKGYTDAQIADLINGSETILETLDAIAQAMEEHQDVVKALTDAIGNKADKTDLESHINNKENPHWVTAEQIGLDNVDNTHDADKDVRSAGKLTNSVKITINDEEQEFDGTQDIKFNIPTGGEGTSDYDDLTNKPSINSRELSGEVSQEDLGWYELTEEDATRFVDNAFKKLNPYDIIAEIPCTASGFGGFGYEIVEKGSETETSFSNDGLQLGTDSYVNFLITNMPSHLTDTDVYVEFDFKCNSEQTKAYLLSVVADEPSKSDWYTLRTASNDTSVLRFAYEHNTSYTSAENKFPDYADGNWHHVSIKFYNMKKNATATIDDYFTMECPNTFSSGQSCKYIAFGGLMSTVSVMKSFGFDGQIKNVSIKTPKEE